MVVGRINEVVVLARFSDKKKVSCYSGEKKVVVLTGWS